MPKSPYRQTVHTRQRQDGGSSWMLTLANSHHITHSPRAQCIHRLQIRRTEPQISSVQGPCKVGSPSLFGGSPRSPHPCVLRGRTRTHMPNWHRVSRCWATAHGQAKDLWLCTHYYCKVGAALQLNVTSLCECDYSRRRSCKAPGLIQTQPQDPEPSTQPRMF